MWPAPKSPRRGTAAVGTRAAVISRHLLCEDRALPLPGQELAAGVGDITTGVAAVSTVGRGFHRVPDGGLGVAQASWQGLGHGASSWVPCSPDLDPRGELQCHV